MYFFILCRSFITLIETWGKNRRALQNKASKQEILTAIATKFGAKTLDIGTIPNSELKKLLNPQTKQAASLVTSRFKKDYIKQLEKAYPTVKGFEKAPISGLRDLLNCLTSYYEMPQ